ncbi:hypothetical protein [Reticulibacter mediterranei]|uniref:hypothetical protein n=1 Tax=Reticulibacter mediterranei TaxID=2778369 RepID=UPI001C68C2AD|nr:hypothetical protein [Reticulibacter mediterranei]
MLQTPESLIRRALLYILYYHLSLPTVSAILGYESPETARLEKFLIRSHAMLIARLAPS